jgi:nucleotide-binding universal stress UspA family protein
MYKNLLVPLDGSATAQLALDEALVLARLSGATVQLLHIVDAMEHITGFEPPAVHIGDIRPRFLRAGQQILEQAAALLQAQGVPCTPRCWKAAASACPSSSPRRPRGWVPI